jgi:hypothetical protein
MRAGWGRDDQVGCARVSAAWFALGGALVGVLGTVLTELVRDRRADQKIWREELRSVCAEFVSALAHLQDLSHELRRVTELRGVTGDAEVQRAAQEAHSRLRGLQERLRLTSKSTATQEAARRLQHLAYYQWKSTRGGRSDFWAAHNEIRDWSAKFYVAARAELGLDGAPVFQDPPDGFPIPGDKRQAPEEG